MQVLKTNFEGLYVIQPQQIGDNRGWFMETYSLTTLQEKGIDTVFVQDNHSYSAQAGTIRGLHGQLEPFGQTRLFRVTRGTVIFYAVDVRKDSPTYKKWFCVELSSGNKKEVYVPKGFLHGYKTVTEHVEMQYKVDVPYNPKYRFHVNWQDKEIGINWGIDHPILSEKDKTAPMLKDVEASL